MAPVDSQHPHRRPNNGAFLHYFRDLANASQYHEFIIRNSCNFPNDDEKNIAYEDFATIETALDILENSSCKSVNLYGEDPDKIWDDFHDSFTNIEAAGGIVKNDENKILFIYRLGKWDLPKGKLEPNESLEHAAVREVEEETGIENLKLQNFIGSTYHTYKERENNAQILKTTFWYLMKSTDSKELIPQTEEGITKVEWKSKDEILSDVLPNTFKNIELILKEAKII